MAPIRSSAVATKNVCTISFQALQRASRESSSAPTPTCAVNDPSTREVSGVRSQGQMSIAVSGARKNTPPEMNAPPAKTSAIRRTPGGTIASPGAGSPESVRWLSHHSANTTSGETM